MSMEIDDNAMINVPSIEDIQQTLVSIDDKPPDFLGSREWLGALEVKFIALSTSTFSVSVLT